MGRGLDGYLISVRWRCAVLKVRGEWSRRFPVAMARGKHLFPFRTEKLSPSAPMVLGPQGPGRVGRRRFLKAPDRANHRELMPCQPRQRRGAGYLGSREVWEEGRRIPRVAA